ncbi:AAA family ATPase [Ectothiorhodospira shaposhnikovii]|uniref:AAA family ATPase n=1 Tax=Ectothiorhodospira shaposhnikovii TaxID=1054 RepID=UPI001EE7ADD5|nr:AAA family ATPase [Ectothiorhodospira shaposhnikovii]MCG5512777.1 CbbQ/NirQ/NorQ/GpvN family protein [Ectothiorhodospira shaposhnikovii]
MSQKITCQICGAAVHAVAIHLRDEHPEVSLDAYKRMYPDAPLLSEMARQRLAEKKAAAAAAPESEPLKAEMAESATVTTLRPGAVKKPMHEVFKLGKVKAALNGRGEPIPITVLGNDGFEDMIPDEDTAYVFNIELLKTVLLGLELKIPTYLWGHAGVGKSTVIEQICHYTRRPYMRVQHTANTEEAHIVGQMLANEKGTYYEPGPLALAMKHGWTYNADEYDYASPSVLAVYQAVLEGKPLVIKEAPPEWRVVRPHENFRFLATGNTNGAGDDTGLYLGTNLGNAANYSRFGITEHVPYMQKNMEVAVISNQAGIVKEDAEKLVEFAQAVRKSFDGGKMASTIGPRELIYAAKLGLRRGSWTVGLQLAFINRLNKVDRETAEGVAQRIFSTVGA